MSTQECRGKTQETTRRGGIASCYPQPVLNNQENLVARKHRAGRHRHPLPIVAAVRYCSGFLDQFFENESRFLFLPATIDVFFCCVSSVDISTTGDDDNDVSTEEVGDQLNPIALSLRTRSGVRLDCRPARYLL